ncbi:MAG: VWA-like domain-containing protein [Gammaproteobacteria bacterium]|jgi:predicted metal-dependent peptidase
MPDVENKLATARTRLILDKPFLGALVLRLPMVEGDPTWCETTYSDGRTFYYNSDYIDALNDDQTQFALSHEALHCALSHFYRRGHRVKHRWELACDFAVNPLLINDGLKPTPDAMFLREYEGMTAEEIYPCLEDEDNDGERDLERQSNSDDNQDNENEESKDMSDGGSDQERQKNDAQDGSGNEKEEPDGSGAKGAPRPKPLSTQEQEDLSTQWQQRLAAAAQAALQNGKLEGEMARMVDYLLQPKLPWRMLLARFMTMTARDDYSYSRPSTRRGDPAVYPSLRSHETNVVVVIDTSGSISADEIQEFMSEIDAIKSQVRARITLLTCDSELNYGCPWTFEPWDEFAKDIDIRGGGGTSFRPPFEWVADQDKAPDLLMYFTDAVGIFPKVEPMFPVLWLVKGKQPVPFGQRIQLN